VFARPGLEGGFNPNANPIQTLVSLVVASYSVLALVGFLIPFAARTERGFRIATLVLELTIWLMWTGDWIFPLVLQWDYGSEARALFGLGLVNW